MLIIPLKKELYEKIKSGEKTIVYREATPYLERKLWESLMNAVPYDYQELKDLLPPIYCCFQLGYKPATRIKAQIKTVEVVDGKDTYLNVDKPVYEIHFTVCLDSNE